MKVESQNAFGAIVVFEFLYVGEHKANKLSYHLFLTLTQIFLVLYQACECFCPAKYENQEIWKSNRFVSGDGYCHFLVCMLSSIFKILSAQNKPVVSRDINYRTCFDMVSISSFESSESLCPDNSTSCLVPSSIFNKSSIKDLMHAHQSKEHTLRSLVQFSHHLHITPNLSR